MRQLSIGCLHGVFHLRFDFAVQRVNVQRFTPTREVSGLKRFKDVELFPGIIAPDQYPKDPLL